MLFLSVDCPAAILSPLWVRFLYTNYWGEENALSVCLNGMRMCFAACMLFLSVVSLSLATFSSISSIILYNWIRAQMKARASRTIISNFCAWWELVLPPVAFYVVEERRIELNTRFDFTSSLNVLLHEGEVRACRTVRSNLALDETQCILLLSFTS